MDIIQICPYPRKGLILPPTFLKLFYPPLKRPKMLLLLTMLKKILLPVLLFAASTHNGFFAQEAAPEEVAW